jgi:hypothetical protein
MNRNDSNPRSATAVFLRSATGIISGFSTKRQARGSMACGDLLFDSLTELMRVTAEWSSTRLVHVWNNIPGVVPVKKFASRQTAVDRISKAIQRLVPRHPQEADRPPRESGTTSARVRTENARSQSQAVRRCVLPEWTISTGVEVLTLARHVRLSPAPKLGGWAGKLLRFLSVSRGESVIRDIDPGNLAVIRRQTGLPILQRMWFHPQGFCLGYTKPRGSSEPAELFFFNTQARLTRQEYLSATVIEASAGTDQWFIACRNGRVYAFSLEGLPLWNTLVPYGQRDNSINELHGLPIFHPRLQLAASQDLLAIAAGEELHCYDTRGRLLWSWRIQDSVNSRAPAVSADLPTRERRLATLGLSDMVGRQQIRTGYLRLAIDTIGNHGCLKQAAVSDIEGVFDAGHEQPQDLHFDSTRSALQVRIAAPFTPRITVLRASRMSIVFGTQDGFVHEYDREGTLRQSFRIGDAAVSEVLVRGEGLKAAYCGGRLTLFDAGRIVGTTELPAYYAELADCRADVLVWNQNTIWLVDGSARFQSALETDLPIRGAWGHAAGFYALGAELVSFQLRSPARHRRRS